MSYNNIHLKETLNIVHGYFEGKYFHNLKSILPASHFWSMYPLSHTQISVLVCECGSCIHCPWWQFVLTHICTSAKQNVCISISVHYKENKNIIIVYVAYIYMHTPFSYRQLAQSHH